MDLPPFFHDQLDSRTALSVLIFPEKVGKSGTVNRAVSEGEAKEAAAAMVEAPVASEAPAIEA